MKNKVYLVIDIDGVRLMTKNPPSLQSNQRAVCIDVSVDDSIFEHQFLRKEINITEDNIIDPDLDVQLIAHAEEKL